MKEQIQSALADMKSKIGFDPKSHVYVENATGLGLQGVSTVSSIVPKDWLAAWGAKEAVKALGYSDYTGDEAVAKETLEKIKQLSSPKEWIALLKEAKGASSRKSKKALVDGKAGHKWLEDFVGTRVNGTEAPMPPGGTLFRPISQFLHWEKEAIQEWVASEALVCWPEKGYAGTLDAIAILKTGELALIDFKFASHLGEDYYLQTAGYAAVFEPYEIKFDKRIIIRLPKTEEREEWNQREFKYEMKPNNIEVLEVPTKYEIDRDAFLHALPLKAWINYVTKLSSS